MSAPCGTATSVWGPSPLIALRRRMEALQLGRSVTRALLLDTPVEARTGHAITEYTTGRPIPDLVA